MKKQKKTRSGWGLIIGLLCLGNLAVHAQTESVRDVIAGQFPGVQVLSDDGAPGAAFSVRIRGLRSLRGDTQPLYVLDGIILNSPLKDVDQTFWSDPEDYQALQSTLDQIDPADIEKVEILKDAAATAIYGALGGNGVVVITTRHGKAGEKLRDWSSSVSLTEKMNISHRHHVALGGGENRGSYYFSAGYAMDNGTISRSSLERFTVNTKYDQGFGRDSRMGVALAFALRNNAMVMATSPLGSSSTVKAGWPVSPRPGEPVETWLEAYDDYSTQYSVDPHFYLDAGLGAGFRIKADAGFDFRNKTRFRWVGAELQRAAEIKGETGQTNSTAVRVNADARLSYSLDAAGHKLDLDAGAACYGDQFVEYIYEGQSFFSQLLRAPGISIAEKVAPYRHPAISQFATALFATGSYSYRDRYFIGGSFRAEQSRKYDNKMGDGGLYPSVYAAWDLARESFIADNLPWLSQFKIRADWGKSGTQDIRPYGYTPYYITGVAPSFTVDGLTNYYDLRWTNLTEHKEAGVDFAFFKDRVSGSVGLYDLRSTDKMRYYYHELHGAYEPVYSNSAVVSNRGVEVALNGKILDGSDVKWTLGTVFSFNDNVILDNGSTGDLFGTPVGTWNGAALPVTVNRTGESVASFYGYKSQGLVGKEHTLLTPAFFGARLKEGDIKFIDTTGDGNITAEDQTAIGHPLPRFLAGLTNSFSYKGFTLDFQLEGAFGFDVANLQRFYSDPSLNMGTAQGTDVFSSRLVEDASYVRLSQLSFSYGFQPGRWRFIESVRVKLSAANLLTLTGYTGADPFVNGYGYDVTRLGIDNGAYPSFRRFMLGLTVSF